MRPALCTLHSRVFGLTIRRLPNRLKLAGRSKETMLSRQEAAKRLQHWYRKRVNQSRNAHMRSQVAVQIQRVWRGYRTRKLVKREGKARERVQAWVVGWKTRRIWRLRCVQRLIAKIKRMKPEQQRVLKLKLHEKVRMLWNGSWVRADKCLSICASPASAVSYHPSSACKTENSVISTEASCSPYLHRTDSSVEDFLICERLASQPSPKSVFPGKKETVLPVLDLHSAFMKSLSRVQSTESFKELRALLEQERRLWLV